jgi:tRNA(Arg) A34 adenosine deaminase TadA
MCQCTRRAALFAAGTALLAAGARAQDNAGGRGNRHAPFVAAAHRMKDQAIAAGDQPYGAVVVRGNDIIGYGPSRVVTDRDPNAHAERVAIQDAQRQTGNNDLTGTILYSTSRPCDACERAAAAARIGRMLFGKEPTDAGIPRDGH